MYYPGDQVLIILPLQRSDGSAKDTTVPKITVLNAVDGSVTQASADMQVVAGSVYRYAWSTTGLSDGVYLAFASYIADGLSVQDQFLREIHIGDTRIPGPVALDATCAKDSTVAKAADVLNMANYVTPDNSELVQAIKAKLDSFPVAVGSEMTLQTVLALVTDVWNQALGSLIVNKTDGTLTALRTDQTELAKWNLQNSNSSSSRVRI